MKFSAHDIDILGHAIETLEEYINATLDCEGIEGGGWAPNYDGIEVVRYTVRRLREMENEARNETFPV